MVAGVADPNAQCGELDAIDGHDHKAACFDPKTADSAGNLGAVATGHFFRMNLRTHHLSTLAMATPKDGKKKKHDMSAIKRITADGLLYGAATGRKVLQVWDNAALSTTTERSEMARPPKIQLNPRKLHELADWQMSPFSFLPI